VLILCVCQNSHTKDIDSGSVVRRGDVVYEVDEVDRVDHVSASGQARRYGQDRDAPVLQL